MPNYVTNIIEFSGNQNHINLLLGMIKGNDPDKDKGVIDFEKIIPMPEHIFRGNLGPKEREEYGKQNWYDWSINNWETKWNSLNTIIDGNIIVFDTAWSSPTPIFKKLSEIILDKDWAIDFTVVFADEDMGCNTGYFKCISGDTDYDYYNSFSHEAYNAYVKCNGESDCLYKDSNGNFNKYDCDDCPNNCM